MSRLNRQPAPSGKSLQRKRSRLLSVVLSSALVAGLLSSVALVAAPAAQAATNQLALDVTAARTVNPDPGFVHVGDPVPHYKWLLQKADVGNTNDSLTNCLSPANDTATVKHDPNYPNNCQWPSLRNATGYDPIVASGDETTIGSIKPLDNGHYVISVKADGYEIGGANFDAPMAGNVSVKLQPYPIPLANIRIRVFHDSAPVDGVYEADVEPVISGFHAYLNDLLGDVTTDYYGNPLCTKYLHSGRTPAKPEGEIIFDADGKPIISASSTGQCVSDANGDILIPNIAPGRYGVTVRQSAAKSTWIQTTTLEGALDHDWWVQAGDTGYGTETTKGGELIPEVQFGYVQPRTTSTALLFPQIGATDTNPDAANVTRALGSGSIVGAVHEACSYIASPAGGVYAANVVPGAGGSKDCGPIKDSVVSLSALDKGDQVVATADVGADGTFTFPNVAKGNYMLTAWDRPINHILETTNVTVNSTSTPTDVGSIYLGGWFTKIHGYVFVDRNGNGKRDPGEPGVVRTNLTLRERDNTPMDQFINSINTDANGFYDISQGYPLTRWLILEHVNPRYKPIGYTTQACNEDKPTTHLGGAVDISILPVLGLCGEVDWAVQPYDVGTTGGIAGTVTYGTTRNELNPAVAATENWQPGIPGVPVHLYAPALDAQGNKIINPDGSYKKGPELTSAYTSETFAGPSGCTARDRNGDPLTGQTLTPAYGDQTKRCVEAPLMGWQAKPGDDTPGAAAQTVNGNYGFTTSDLNLYAPGDPKNPAPNHDLPLYADLATAGYPAQTLIAGDYIVSVEIPKDANGQDAYKVTKEEDVNIFSGDQMEPQENFPPTQPPNVSVVAPQAPAPAANPNANPGGGAGEYIPCVGPLHTVNVTDPDFLAGGGSPYQGLDKPLCTDKLVSINDTSTGATNFELFTDVPIATHFWGLILNDLGVSSDPSTVQYGEVEGLRNAPTGIYDWAGQLVDTVQSDRNGFYEAVVPSTTRINNPSPTGVSPNIYRLVGNDPGQPGHLNQSYNPRFRTIAANFQAWPGLFTVTDTAPTLAASQTFQGQMTAVKCDVPTSEPEVFAVDDPVIRGARTLTIKGRNFGTQGASSAVFLGAPGASTGALGVGQSLAITSWTDNQITVTVPNISNANLPGRRQLQVRNAGAKYSATGVTMHVIGTVGANNYNPTVITVGPGKQFDTDQGAHLQDALEAAATLGPTATSVVVAYPETPTVDSPLGVYFENIVIHSGTIVQGVGQGGFDNQGNWIPGSFLDGIGYENVNSQAWMNLVGSLSYVADANSGIETPDGATVTVLTPMDGVPVGSVGIDGFDITGGTQNPVATNVNVLNGGSKTPYLGTGGAAITQGGGVYIHAGTNGVAITNNKIDSNSGTYGGGIRVGTPYADGLVDPINGNRSEGPNDRPITTYLVENQNLVVAHNRILNNGGMNLAGGVGLFSGSTNYKVSYNDVCGNFSAEYGGGISHFGLSRNASIDHNRVWFNESYDEGGGIMVAGELPPNASYLSAGSGEVTVDSNRLAQNLSNDDGGAIRTLNARDWRINMTNNEITGNVSAHEGGGIALNDTTNAVISNSTIANNVTTATAVTSNGLPAAAGIATAGLSQQLQATLPVGAPTFTRPVNFNNALWDNRSGSWNGTDVIGIGAVGDPTPVNNWDIGSQDLSGDVTPYNSDLQTINGTTLAGGAMGTNISADPKFRVPQVIAVHPEARRSFTNFRQMVIWDMTQSPWNTQNYTYNSSSPAKSIGAASIVDLGTTYTSPTVDINGTVRGRLIDAGSSQAVDTAPSAPSGVTVTPGDRSLKVSWAAPLDNGGQPVNGYTATAWNAQTGGTASAVCRSANAVTLTCTITGLVNGTTYYVDVAATNRIGTGAASTPRITGTPIAPPSAPLNVGATGGAGTAVVTWSAPASSGGAAITAYTATAWSAANGGTSLGTCGWTTGPLTCTISGLVGGTRVYVDVTATNIGATGPASAPRVAVTPLGVPAAPTNVRVNTGRGAFTVSWTAPANNGGSAITSYTATAWNQITGGGVVGSCTTANGTTLTCNITGMAGGQAVFVDVTATNVIGTGPASAPRVGANVLATPDAPTAVVVTAGNGQATVSWTAPVNNGGSAITRYTATAWSAVTGGTAARTCTTGNGATVTCVITGLTNATTYWFDVTATNANGTGPASTPRVSGLPAGVPGVPTSITATPGDGQVAVAWLAPASDGGSAITGYTATAWSRTNGGTALGTCTWTNGTLGCPIMGLANGTTVYVSVTATNLIGTGTASAPRVAATPAGPATAPGIPTAVRVTSSRAVPTRLTVAWTAAADGGSPITGSTVTLYTAQTGGTSAGTCTVIGTGTNCQVNNLARTTTYWAEVTSTNAIGTGLPSTPRIAGTTR